MVDHNLISKININRMKLAYEASKNLMPDSGGNDELDEGSDVKSEETDVKPPPSKKQKK